jgi:hypothetical protein
MKGRREGRVRARCPLHGWVDANTDPDHQPRITIYPTTNGEHARLIFRCELCDDWRHHTTPEGRPLEHAASARYAMQGVWTDDLSSVPVHLERDSLPPITFFAQTAFRMICELEELAACAVVEFIERALADT